MTRLEIGVVLVCKACVPNVMLFGYRQLPADLLLAGTSLDCFLTGNLKGQQDNPSERGPKLKWIGIWSRGPEIPPSLRLSAKGPQMH